MPLPARDRKIKKRTGFGPHPRSAKKPAGCSTEDRQKQPRTVAQSAIGRRTRAPCKWVFTKKRTGFGPHLLGGKSKPVAATNDHQNQLRASSGEAMRYRNRAPCKLGFTKKRTGLGPQQPSFEYYF